ncbi:hypothetical protein CTI12_AA310530 [Artemisia annua]|uniref:Reverse transcriptase domain-containing protein n=1 Tax=Artemisia annua TaxID=35608 RepID=A0A2U1N447_ARTAN|nr:hypothetical protein CTI12_AA310530 [Artemisia annua]
MAPKRPRRPINRSPMSGYFKTPKKAKKPTVVGESPVFQQIINQQLEDLMPEIVNHVSAQMGAHPEGAGSGGSGSNGCTYMEFVACKPKEFDGKGGAIALTRWLEKMESVMDISGCTEGQKLGHFWQVAKVLGEGCKHQPQGPIQERGCKHQPQGPIQERDLVYGFFQRQRGRDNGPMIEALALEKSRLEDELNSRNAKLELYDKLFMVMLGCLCVICVGMVFSNVEC